MYPNPVAGSEGGIAKQTKKFYCAYSQAAAQS